MALERIRDRYTTAAPRIPTYGKRRLETGQRKERPVRLVSLALEANVITKEEAALLEQAEDARDAAIAVDAFDLSDYLRTATIAEGGAEDLDSPIETQPV